MFERLELVACPEAGCVFSAEVRERYTLDGTAGPVKHVKIACIAGHHFNMPEGMLHR